MTLNQVNEKLGQPWFHYEHDMDSSGMGIVYSEDDDTFIIELDKVFHVEETGTSRDFYVWYGEGPMPEEGDGKSCYYHEDVIIYSLDKYQARGATTCIITPLPGQSTEGKKYVVYDPDGDLSGPPSEELLRKEYFFISGTKEEILESIWKRLIEDGEFGGFTMSEDTPETIEKELSKFR